MAARPRHSSAAEEYAADHQKQHRLLRPGNGGVEEITADDIRKIQHHAAKQQHPRYDAKQGKERSNKSQQHLDHSANSLSCLCWRMSYGRFTALRAATSS